MAASSPRTYVMPSGSRDSRKIGLNRLKRLHESRSVGRWSGVPSPFKPHIGSDAGSPSRWNITGSAIENFWLTPDGRWRLVLMGKGAGEWKFPASQYG